MKGQDMATLTEKQYKQLAADVGLEKMKAIEKASGVTTGLLESPKEATKTNGSPKDSKKTVSLNFTKEELLREMKKHGCTVADYNVVKFGKKDHVLVNHEKTEAQKETIVVLHEQVTDHLVKSFGIALSIGEILFDLKQNHIKKREFGQWMRQNLPFSVRTGQRYMNIFIYREDLARKGIKNLVDAYREINGEPLDNEELEADDGTDTSTKWEVVSATADVDNVKLPKKKLKRLEETVQINPEIVERMEQKQAPFCGGFSKLVATIPSKVNKSLLSRFVIAANNLLVPGGKLIFVKRK
jgi:hypothetical protein